MVNAARRTTSFAVEKVNSVLILSVAALFMQIPSFYGEDIVNARNNYLDGPRTDFWGGISTLIYAHVPDSGFRWQIWLAIFQITLTSIALNKTLPRVFHTKRKNIIKYVAIYSALTFGSQMTRDGLMFSLLIFGFAILNSMLNKHRPIKLIIWPILIICLAMSFRPWLSIAVLPLITMILKVNKIQFVKWATAGLVISITLTPLAFEYLAAKSLRLEKSFPQQQVMLMDVAATYCYTTNTQTGERAARVIQNFSDNPNYKSFVCQLYRPDTWLSLTKSINTSSSGFEADFKLIQTGNVKQYDELESKWLEIIIKDPVTYIQNKVLFASKLLIGSDSRDISILSAESTSTRILGIYKFAYDIAITLHLFSLFACILILFLIPTKRYLKNRNEGLYIDQYTIHILSSILIWNSLSAIAYIGSNGRYTYALSLLSLVLYLSHKGQQQIKIDKNE
jgi:hypothetical protein